VLPTVIAIIPARSQSKGVKNKNIKNLAGLPLLAWSIRTCLKSKFIKKIVVSTDSKKYAKIAKKYGANEIIIRPKKISTDRSTDYDVVYHVISYLKNINCEYIAYIRPTTPQRNINDIDKAIKIFSLSKHDSLRSVHEMPETSYKSFEIFKKDKLKSIANLKFSLDDLNKPRQLFKKTYAGNGVIDIFRRKFILKNKKLFGKKVMPYITAYTEEIDSLSQFKYINFLLKKN
jgi:CMP-N,N'-diacetyllegionaminic acid synthase